MLNKILIAEDRDDINKGLQSTLNGLSIHTIHQTQYCDEALLKIQKAIQDQQPYDLLITDLSFEEDHITQKLKSGNDLTKAIFDRNIAIPIIVYSVEDRLQHVRSLVNEYGIKGYVCKGRHGLQDLQKAIKNLNNDTVFLSDRVKGALKTSQNNDISNYDCLLMTKLSEGFSQPQIAGYLKNKNISPSSLSSVEKRLIKLKDIFRANNTAHLVAVAKDAGFI